MMAPSVSLARPAESKGGQRDSYECAQCAPALGSISSTRKGAGANVKGTGEN